MYIQRRTGPGTYEPHGTIGNITADGAFDKLFTIQAGTNLAHDERYKFAVSVKDAAGNESATADCQTNNFNPGDTSLGIDTQTPGAITTVTITSSGPTNTGIMNFEWSRMPDDTTPGAGTQGEMGYTFGLYDQDKATLLVGPVIIDRLDTFTIGNNTDTFAGLSDGKYWLGIYPWDGAENQGTTTWKGPFKVDTEAPLSPTLHYPVTATGAPVRMAVTQPSFFWSDESFNGATSYTLTVVDSSFNSTEYVTTEPFYTLTPAEALGDEAYTWSVIAEDDAGNQSIPGGSGEAGELPSFEIDTTAPGAVPELKAPVDGAEINTQGLTFAFMPGPLPGPLVYTVEVYDGALSLVYTKSCEVQPGTECYYHITSGWVRIQANDIALGEEAYTWKVRVADDLGNASGWTGPWLFTIDDTPPNPPALFSPEDGSFTNQSNVTFQWSDETESGATGYRLILIYEDGGDWYNAAGSPFPTGGNSRPTDLAAVMNPLGVERSYRYFVVSSDGAGNTSSESGSWEFTVDTQAPQQVNSVTLSPGSRQILANRSSLLREPRQNNRFLGVTPADQGITLGYAYGDTSTGFTLFLDGRYEPLE